MDAAFSWSIRGWGWGCWHRERSGILRCAQNDTKSGHAGALSCAGRRGLSRRARWGERRRNLESRASDARWIRTLTLILSLSGRGEDGRGFLLGRSVVGGGVVGIEEDPGFFAALRMTQKVGTQARSAAPGGAGSPEGRGGESRGGILNRAHRMRAG